MNWNHFIKDYNELTAFSFDYLYHFNLYVHYIMFSFNYMYWR